MLYTQEVNQPVHDKFKGDAQAVRKELIEKNAYEPINFELVPDLKFLSPDILVPLETQRLAREKWAKQRMLDVGGLDMWAFGALSVCYDPRDKKYYVWDGCGRLALAQIYGLTQVPCIVIEGEKERAAFYFGYTQDSTQGRRTLSKEVLFVNRYYSGDVDAITEANNLDTLGLYVQGDTNYPIPNPQRPGHIEIKYRAFSEGAKIMNNDITLQRQVRDMIVTAWTNNPMGIHLINQDIYWALGELLATFPQARKNGINTALQHFLNNLASGKNQEKVDWKPKGLSGNSGVSKLLALGLLKAFKEGSFWKPSYQNVLIKKQLEV